MATIRRSITIHAPIERVFDYVADPRHLPTIWPSLAEVRNVESRPNGSAFDWDYKVLGMRVHGHSDPVELVKNERLVNRSVKGIPNTFRWSYASRADNTEVTLEVDYEVPMLGKLGARMIGKINEREADALLGNLKRTMEAGPG